jgi:hypothetical protein
VFRLLIMRKTETVGAGASPEGIAALFAGAESRTFYGG